MTNEFQSNYVSARAIPELVGRNDILQLINDAIADPTESTYVIYVTAEGGWGKTRLLEEALIRAHLNQTDNILVAHRLVDMYHAYTHSEEGLATDIVEALDIGDKHFQNYLKERAEFNRVKYDLAEILRTVTQQRSRMMGAFTQDLYRVGERYKMVLGIDTLETLVYETDRVQDALGLTEEPIGVTGWLVKEFLPKTRRAVILIAGRPESPQLVRELQKISGIKFITHKLKKFTEKESLAYFEAVTTAAEKDNLKIAKRISKVPKETKLAMHYLANGQPLRLSLFVDYLAVARDLIFIERTLAEKFKKKRGEYIEEIEKLRLKLDDAIVSAFQEANRPLDEIIRALAWAPKGMNAELLAWILQRGKPSDENIAIAKEFITMLYQPDLRLSFIKIRPGDVSEIVFLQDEMYRLLQRGHDKNRQEQKARHLNQVILEYYADAIKREVAHINIMQKNALELIYSNPMRQLTDVQSLHLTQEQDELRKSRAHLQNLQVEQVYYSLQINPLKGLEAYSKIAEEAFQSNEFNLWLLLRDELLKYAKPYRGGNAADEEALTIIDGDIGVHWIKSNIASGAYDKASQQIHRFRETCRDLLVAGSYSDLNLKIWEGWLLTYSGRDVDQAEKFLPDAIEQIKQLPDDTEFDSWRKQLLLAYAQDTLGYLYRSKGNFKEAVEYYKQNLPLWRSLKTPSEQANTLNNLAWALAEMGDFQSAILYCEDGLGLRRQLGRRYPVALSLNTLGLIETRSGQPERAHFRCEQALTIFRELEQPRGIGLACTALSEALRRMINVPDLFSDEKAFENLKLAEKYALEAVDIFTNQVQETLRMVEAYLELGCVYREWARRLSSDNNSRQEKKQASENALREATRHAGETFGYRAVDALVNLAWLHYYMEDTQGAHNVIMKEVYPRIDEKYLFTKLQVPTKFDNAISWYWVQLGKAELLLGKIAFDEYVQANQAGELSKAEEKLMAAAGNWTLAMGYDRMYGEEYRDFVAGKKEIYQCLGKLNVSEFEWIWQGIQHTYTEYSHAAEFQIFELLIIKQFGPVINDGLTDPTIFTER